MKEFTPTQSTHTCPNCGNDTATATNINSNYPETKNERRDNAPLWVIRCYICKRSTQGYANENLAIAAMSKEMI